MDLFNYSRRQATEVNIGATPMGGAHPIRIQSMTNTVTLDTEACVGQAKRIIDAGGEYVRMTTQGVREAENMMNINIGLRSQGYDTPLVADVHFNPNVADVAAQYVEKVRLNPGNYVDAARTFKKLEYTDEEYAQEIEKIRARLIPFLNIFSRTLLYIDFRPAFGQISVCFRADFRTTQIKSSKSQFLPYFSLPYISYRPYISKSNQIKSLLSTFLSDFSFPIFSNSRQSTNFSAILSDKTAEISLFI